MQKYLTHVYIWFYFIKTNHSTLSLVSFPAWFRNAGNLTRYMGDVPQGSEWEPALSPIPSSEQTTSSCITFTRFQDESYYPQAIKFFIERSNLPQARSQLLDLLQRKWGKVKGGLNKRHFQLFHRNFPSKVSSQIQISKLLETNEVKARCAMEDKWEEVPDINFASVSELLKLHLFIKETS